MNKLFKAVMAVIVCAVMAVSGAASAFAETIETADAQSDIESNPVVVNYYLTSTKGKNLTSVSKSTEFNIRITVKDLSVKTNEIGAADDIDFIKSIDRFKCGDSTVSVTSSGSGLLMYTIELSSCKWSGGDTSFGFMVGYLSSGEYTTLSFDMSECTESVSSSDSDYTAAQPIFRITAGEPSAPIKAGDSGEFTLTVKNMGSVEAERILVEISSSDDILIVDETGSQEIRSLTSGESEKLEIKYKALDKITASKQTFSVSVQYYYDDGANETQGSTTASINLAGEISTTEKVYPVILSEFSLSELELSPNTVYDGTITIRNIGTADMNGAFISLTGSDSFVLTDGTSSFYIDSIKQGGSVTLDVKIRTLNEISSLRQELAMAISYTYVMGSEELDGSYQTEFTMFAPLDGSEPFPYVTFTQPEEPLSAAAKYRYYLYIENKGDVPMENVVVSISASEGINLIDGTDTAYIESIDGGGKKSVRIMLETAAELLSAYQTLDVRLDYSYTAAGKRASESQETTVKINSEISSAPVVRITGERLSSAITAGEQFDYTITVTNYGDISVRDIYIDLTASDSLYFLDGTEYAHIDLIRPQKSAEITVSLAAAEQISSFKQTVTANAVYSYGVVTAEKQGTTEASLAIIAAGAADSSDMAVPNIIISAYDMGADQIAAGEDFVLSVDFYNTSSVTAVENLIMTVNAGGDVNIGGGTNTYFYPTLGESGILHEDIQLRALASAETGVSSVTISFRYDYVDGGTRSTASADQTLYIPIYQPDKMTFEVSAPTYTVYSGNDVYITTTYMNKGRSDVSNCKAEIVGDIEALSTSKVLGNLAPGANGSFDFIVTPYVGGQCEFTIKVTYEDAALNEVVKEYPVSFYVEEPVYDSMGWDDYEEWDETYEEEGGFPWAVVWIAAGVLVAGGAVTLIIVIKRKKKGKRKKLTEDDIDWEDDLDDVFSDSSSSSDGKETKV